MIRHPHPLRLTAAALALTAALACSDDGASSTDGAEGDSGLPGADASGDANADTATAADTTADVAPDVPGPDLTAPITEAGPYPVGYRVLTTEYTPDGDSDARPLRIALWYPAGEAAGEPAEYSGLNTREEVFADAPLGVEGVAPLLIYSHGDRGYAEASFFLTEYFASHGWIVAAPDHATNTIWDAGQERQDGIYAWRPQDVSATIDHLLTGLPAEDPLTDHVNDAQIVVTGHSFGGYTSLALAGSTYQVDDVTADCARYSPTFCDHLAAGGADRLREGFRDPRVQAAIPMAPGNTPLIGAGGDTTAVPVLLITGALDMSSRNDTIGDPYWAGLDGPEDVRIDLATAGHMTFSDACGLFPGLFSDDGCGDGFLPAEVAHPIINAYSMAFARYHLWGDDTDLDLLLGERSLDPDEINLSRKDR